MENLQVPLFGDLEESSSPEEENENGAGDSSLAVAKTGQNQPSTRVSLLVEALVKSVVSAYETDRLRAKKSYKKICRRLFQMGLIDESWNMEELEGARVQFEHAFFQLLDNGSMENPSPPLYLQGAYYSSQYTREFEEFEKIGGGAFGKVFRVKHKLDGSEYAVKKIPIHSEGIDSVRKYLSEVKTFASLNHPNIVQYKAAWLEIGSALDDPTWERKGRLAVNEPFFGINEPFTESLRRDSESNFEIEFRSGSHSSRLEVRSFNHESHSSLKLPNKSDSSSNSEIAFEHSQDSRPILETSPSPSQTPSPSKAIVPRWRDSSKKSKIQWATLYIQMALCHGTLDQWLRHRNENSIVDLALMSTNSVALRTEAIRQIMMQILRGLQYIHSKGVVHHDIKPSNIFVSAEGGSLLVQLGDFGLACPLQRTRHGFARGTPLYAAPEQLAGRCDPKSDLYSLGIVLYELQQDFGTVMERTRKISELRTRRDPPIPTDLNLSNLVSALVRHRSVERPDASTLLKVLQGSSSFEDLQGQLVEKDKEIERLKERLRELGIEDV